MSLKPPCKRNGKDCEQRHVGCHATCEEYKDFAAQSAALRKGAWDPADEYSIDRVRKNERRNLRKYGS